MSLKVPTSDATAAVSACLKNVIDRLDDQDCAPHESGSGWASLCPAHDDNSPSLSISEGDDGRVLLKCHAECETADVIEALGLTMADLFPAKKSRNGFNGHITNAYDYQDESGNLLYQVCRYEPKDFRQRSPDGSGGWTWKITGVRRVLYRLPEIIAAVQRGETIYICEGEKDVEAMESNGFVATCNSGGATKDASDKKWPDTCTESLRDALVVIIADKDAAGRTHANVVAAKLRGVAKSVRIIELPDRGDTAVKDASDWFAAGGTVDEFNAIVAAAPPFDFDTTSSDEQAQQDPHRYKQGTSADDYLNGDQAERPHAANTKNLVERLAERIYSPSVKPEEPSPRYSLGDVPICTPANLTTISALPKAAKTAAVMAMFASSFAAPTADCLGFSSSNSAGHAIVHIDTEQCPFDHWEGVTRANRRAKVEAAPEWLRSYCLTGFSAADVRVSIRILIQQAAEKFGGVHSVIIDGIADAALDVNDPAESSSLVTELHKLAIEYDCPIINVIHINPGSGFKTRGHLGSQLERKSETNLRLEKDGDGVTVIWADKNRRAPIPKATAPRFAWGEIAAMHVSVGSLRDAKDEGQKAVLGVEAARAFTAAKKTTLTYGSFVDGLMQACNMSKSTARRRLNQMLRTQVLRKDLAGAYSLQK